jgi:SWI/SNF-related matrix-associated actin-dependent regulator 1 of chromatin subfamily A
MNQIPFPAGVSPYPYQVVGAKFILDRPNGSGIIADDVGLGKSCESLLVCNGLPGCPRILVVCPASLKQNWANEAHTWLCPPCSVRIAEGDFWPIADVVIANYEILPRHAEAIRRMPWSLVIVDEAHRLKNQETQRAKNVKKIPSARFLLLTGTPIPRYPIELFPLLNLVDPAGFPDYWDFARRYCNARYESFDTPAGRKHEWNVTGVSNETELTARLAGVMIRRLKTDELPGLPPIIWQVIEIGKDRPVDPDLLTELRSATSRAGYSQAVKKMGGKSLKTLNLIARERKRIGLVKVPHVIEHVKLVLETEKKVLLFAHHIEVIDRLAECLPGNVRIQGETPVNKRQGLVDRFQNDPDARVMIGQITAAGVGLNMTGASVAIFGETPWNPDEIDQCVGRGHRHGQKAERFLVQHIVLPNSMDAHMARTILKKRRTQEKILCPREPFDPLQEAISWAQTQN